jgi:hypothetical protein
MTMQVGDAAWFAEGSVKISGKGAVYDRLAASVKKVNVRAWPVPRPIPKNSVVIGVALVAKVSNMLPNMLP